MAGDITANFTYVESGNTLTFTDISTGSPDAWFWMFGDGRVSLSQHPVHTFSRNGRYNIRLYAYKDASINSHTVTSADEGSSKSLTTTFPSLEEFSAMYTTLSGTAWTEGTASVRHLETASLSPISNSIDIDKPEWSVDLTSVPTSFLNLLKIGSNVVGNWEVFGEIVDRTMRIGTSYVNLWEDVSNDNTVGTFGYSGTITNSVTSFDADGFGSGHSQYDPEPDRPDSRGYFFNADTDTFFTVKSHTSVHWDVVTKQYQSRIIAFSGTPLIGDSPLSVKFTDESTFIAAKSVWDFGNGTTLTVLGSTNPTAIYTTDACSVF